MPDHRTVCAWVEDGDLWLDLDEGEDRCKACPLEKGQLLLEDLMDYVNSEEDGVLLNLEGVHVDKAGAATLAELVRNALLFEAAPALEN